MKKYVLASLLMILVSSCSTDEVLLLDKNCYVSDIQSKVDEKYLTINCVVHKCSDDSNPLSLWALDYAVVLYENNKEYGILGASIVGNEELVKLKLVLDLTQEPVIIDGEYLISLRYNYGKTVSWNAPSVMIIGEAKFIR